jgi:acetyl esterase/lipase
MRNVPSVRGLLLAATIALHLGAADHNGLAEKLHVDFNVPLWADGHVPGAAGDWAVDKPYLTAVLPPEGKGNGAAVIICPGGGNTTLFVHQEGMAIAEHLNSWGVAGFILTYRLNPRYQQDARDLDGRRAVQLLRARSADFKIDQNRIGMMGLSAGGGITRAVGAGAAPGNPSASDAIDRASSRLDFAIMVYGPGRGTPAESLKDFPPTFIIAAAADSSSVASAQLFLDLRKAGVSAEVHLYQKGRHGFGAADGHPILSDWLGRCQNWMKNTGLLKGAD